MISTQVFDRAREYAEQFRDALPFRHVSIDGFLDAGACRNLLEAFPAFSDRHAVNEMGVIGNKAVRTDVGNLESAYALLDATVRSAEFLDLVSGITGIPDLRYDPDYVGGGTHENRHGQALSPHIDFNILPGRRWHRRLNLIIYLNPEWEESWGGCIELHSDPWSPGENRTRSFLPSFNRCVIFETSETSWHGFEEIRLPEARRDLTRKSFAIYLYTEQRPAAETAASHATVYVPKGMPATLRPGAVLGEAEHMELQVRFAQMLGQLKYLYERELEFSGHTDQLSSALDEAHARVKLDLQGYAVQGDGVRGLWPDGWIGTEMRTSFTPTIDADGLVISAWVPDAFTQAQVLDLRLGDSVQQLQVPPGQLVETTIRRAMPAGVPVELQVNASVSWQSAVPGVSPDQRPLAWRMGKAALLHRSDRLGEAGMTTPTA